MSLLIAYVTPADAIVAVDTIGARADGSQYESSKLVPVAHLRSTVIALRGQAGMLHFFYLTAASAGFSTFDELLEATPALLADMSATMPPELLVAAPHVRSGNVMLLVGWSDQQDRMLGRQFVQREEGGAFAAEDFEFHVAPYHDSFKDIPRTPQDVGLLASAQVDWMRATYPGAACGGRLVVAQMTRQGVAVLHRAIPATLEAAA